MTILNHQGGSAIPSRDCRPDAADGDASSRVVRRRYSRAATRPDPATGTGWTPTQRPAGSSNYRELAHWLRVYGGQSLETRLRDARIAAWVSGGCIVATAALTPLAAGWGYASVAWFGLWAMLPLLAVFFEAATRRDRNQKRIEDVEAICARAVAAALGEGGDVTLAEAA
jgi:hypothetical protein